MSPTEDVFSKKSSLFVENITKSDTEKYTCVASSTVFNTTRSFVLDIQGEIFALTFIIFLNLFIANVQMFNVSQKSLKFNLVVLASKPVSF